MIYSIHYDLKRPGQSYDAIQQAIKSCGIWWHHLDSTWLVDTHLDAKGIWDKLSLHTDGNDRILVIGVTNDYEGWLSNEAWGWINSRSLKMVA